MSNKSLLSTRKGNLQDHRQIGRELDLFSFHEVAPGAVFWHPKGWTLYCLLCDFIRQKLKNEGYQEISSPVLVKSQILEQSGHFEFFEHNMFNMTLDEESWSLKPMNCPESTLIYSSKTRSYQDLPLRFSDFGILHRRELSGVVGGLFRVRQFTIDDAHLYVRPDQIQNEIQKLILLIIEVYKSLGFKPEFSLSTKPEKAMGDGKLWQEAEKDLETALKKSKIKYSLKPKEGAFYGPKIDIQIKDAQNRDWQLATIQLDFQMPQRLKLEYIDKDGKAKRPVIIHRAILGSLERFLGILIEHYQGAFPLWLAPVQVVVIPIADRHQEYAHELINQLELEKIRAELDNRQETMQAKIRDATLQKVPYMVIIGDNEVRNSKISARTREGKDLGQKTLSEFLRNLKTEIEGKN